MLLVWRERRCAFETTDQGDLEMADEFPSKRQDQPFCFEDSRHERIHRRLMLIGPGPASFFRDACIIMQHNQSLASATHLIGHLLREIESSLRAVLCCVADKQPKQEQFGSKTAHREEVTQILDALEIPKTDPVAKAWLSLTSKNYNYHLARLAHREYLIEPRPFDDGFVDFWKMMLAILDVVLDKLESCYSHVMPTIEQLVATETPTASDVRALKNSVPSNLVTITEFFERIENPAWLEPLESEGIFQSPPQPIVNEDEKSTSFPPWPASRFLVRMASKHPDEVAAIAGSIPPTQNIDVHADLLDVANLLPPALAATLISQLTTGIESKYGVLFPHKYGSLMLSLAKAECCAAAIQLAKSFFGFRHDVLRNEEKPRQDLSTYVGLFWYEEVASGTVSELASLCGTPTLELFCRLLKTVVLHDQDCHGGNSPEDWSNIWCRDVAHCRGQHDVKCALVAAVRDSACRLIGDDVVELDQVVAILEGHGWKVFDRVALHVMKGVVSDNLRIPSGWLADRARFDDQTSRREYNELAEVAFEHLDDGVQTMILGWIDKGPNATNYRDGIERLSGIRPTIKESNAYAERWRRDRLHPIRESLPPSLKQRYEQLVAELGVPEDPPLVSCGFVGRESPLDANEMQAMPVADLVKYLTEWAPANEYSGPSRVGLAELLQHVVCEDPERFLSSVDFLRGLPSPYLAAVLEGLVKAHQSTWKKEWWTVALSLCTKDGFQSVEPLASSPAELQEQRGSRWPSRQILDLVSAGLDKSDHQIPFAHRSTVWQVLQPLTNDPDPTPDDDLRSFKSGLDAFTCSINSVRGMAIRVAIKYALWVWRNKRAQDNDESTGMGNFEIMPEVRNALDQHLNLEHDPSLAVRAVYGELFPQLCTLDLEWATTNSEAVFPTDPKMSHSWAAAWCPFMIYSNPYIGVFNVLQNQYRHAIEEIEVDLGTRCTAGDPREDLGEHMAYLYWTGALTLEENGLFALFFRKAPIALRKHVLEYVGRFLRNAESAIPTATLNRLRVLWEFRCDSLATESKDECIELAAFGWWCVSGAFGLDWSLGQLRRSLEMCRHTEPDFLVLELFQSSIATYPTLTLQCLTLIVDGDEKGWSIAGRHDEVRAVLETALGGGNEDARELTISLVNRLFARGLFDFREIL